MVCSIFRHPHGNVSLRGTPTSFAWCFFMCFRSHHLETAECPEMSWMCYTFWGPIGWSSLMFLSQFIPIPMWVSCVILCLCPGPVHQGSKSQALHPTKTGSIVTQLHMARTTHHESGPADTPQTNQTCSSLKNHSPRFIHPNPGPQAIPDLLCLLGVPKLY